MTPSWLPSPLDFAADYSGNWDGFLEDAYTVFEGDFITNVTRYRSKKVILSDRFPDLGDGKHGSFWHVISTGDGKSESTKVPDIKRAQVVGWIKPVLENCPDSELLEWEEIRSNGRRRNDKRVIIWYKSLDFVIILRKLDYVYVLITAHTVDYGSTRRKLQAAYDKSQS